MKRILFVCKGNRFRSQLAEGFFKKLNKNKKYKATSCGVIKGRPIAWTVKKVARKHKLRLSKPKTISEKDLGKQDFIIIVADNVTPITFKAEKRAGKVIKWWGVKDESVGNLKEIENKALIIRKKVKSLLKTLR